MAGPAGEQGMCGGRGMAEQIVGLSACYTCPSPLPFPRAADRWACTHRAVPVGAVRMHLSSATGFTSFIVLKIQSEICFLSPLRRM